MAGKSLCICCQRINFEALISKCGQEHVTKWSQLQPENCHLCKLISSYTIHPTQEDGPVRLALAWEYSKMGSLQGQLKLQIGKENSFDFLYREIFVITLPGSKFSHFVPEIATLTNTSSNISFEKARRWLNHCFSNHDCSNEISILLKNLHGDHPIQHSLKRPTRLLDLNAFQSPIQDVQLVENLTSMLPYATLSHCWGTKVENIPKTTKSKLGGYMEKISYNILPPTFRDAIDIARRLDLRYLWIDSLCIVQDSIKDWRREASTMAEVYSGSYVMISSDWSPSPAGGCFSPHIPYKPDILDNTIEVGEMPPLHFTHGGRSSLSYISENPLATRAWAFQERLLSPRILHYTQSQLYWECRCAFAAEDNIPRIYHPFALYPALIPDLLRLDSIKIALGFWYERIVSSYYSNTNLTIPQDRLLAISAVARACSPALSSSSMEYLAGVWLKELWYGLCWYRKQQSMRHDAKPKCTTYIAPSWSWASINAPVSWTIRNVVITSGRSAMTVRSTGVTLVGEDPFGGVYNGFIKLTGRCLKNTEPKSNLNHPEYRNESQVTIYLDDPVFEGAEDKLIWLLVAINRDWCVRTKDFVDFGHFILISPVDDISDTYVRRGIGKCEPVDVWFSDCYEKTVTII